MKFVPTWPIGLLAFTLGLWASAHAQEGPKPPSGSWQVKDFAPHG